jgi:hypothetical protein
MTVWNREYVLPELIAGTVSDDCGGIFVATRLHVRVRLTGVVIGRQRHLRIAAGDECVEPRRRNGGKRQNNNFPEHWGVNDMLADLGAGVVR